MNGYKTIFIMHSACIELIWGGVKTAWLCICAPRGNCQCLLNKNRKSDPCAAAQAQWRGVTCKCHARKFGVENEKKKKNLHWQVHRDLACSLSLKCICGQMQLGYIIDEYIGRRRLKALFPLPVGAPDVFQLKLAGFTPKMAVEGKKKGERNKNPRPKSLIPTSPFKPEPFGKAVTNAEKSCGRSPSLFLFYARLSCLCAQPRT